MDPDTSELADDALAPDDAAVEAVLEPEPDGEPEEEPEPDPGLDPEPDPEPDAESEPELRSSLGASSFSLPVSRMPRAAACAARARAPARAAVVCRRFEAPDWTATSDRTRSSSGGRAIVAPRGTHGRVSPLM